MKGTLAFPAPQPFTAICLAVIAVLASLNGLFFWPRHSDEQTLQVVLVSLFLTGSIAVGGLKPIHIRHNLKIVVSTVPLYVTAILLPPVAAALVAGAGMLILQVLTHNQRGNTLSDILTATARWSLTGLLCAMIATAAPILGAPLFLNLISTATAMFMCDMVLGSLEIAPMSGDSPRRVMLIVLQEAGLSEATQYLIGILAALAALTEIWSLVLWVPPLWIIYWSLKQAKEMHDGTSQLLESLADTVDLRDPYTGGHSRRVTEYALHILNTMGIIGPEVDLIRTAARVHDIGKIGIPDSILNKPGRLSGEEKAIMDSHAERGAVLLSRYHDFARGSAIVRHHHERWDGQGYPDRLKGLDIPFGARIIAVADSFDAMTSDRPYRAGMPVAQAARILREDGGKQWDPAIVEAFLRCTECQDVQSSVASAPAPT